MSPLPAASSSGGVSQVQAHRAALQRRTCIDWAQRQHLELMSGSIKRIADFINTFHTSVRGKLSALEEKLTDLERKVDYLEARVGVSEEEGSPETSKSCPNPDESEA